MVDYELKDLFLRDSTEKQLKISYGSTTITNEDLFGEEFTMEESLCSEQQLRFGSCEASVVSFKVANIFSPMKGKTIDIKVFLEGNSNPFQYGYYRVDSDKLTADKQWREVTAYDAMFDIINSDVIDWYNTILPDENSSVTMREFRGSFISHFGLSESPATLVNDDIVIKKTIGVAKSEEPQAHSESVISESVTLSGKDVITAICEINGCFGHIGRDGKFHYVYLDNIISGLYPANDLYPSDDLYPAEANTYPISKSMYISCKYEDYECAPIDKLQIRQEGNDIGAVVGEGENSYVIENNFLVYGKSSEELQEIGGNLLQKIKAISYRPFDIECVGNPCLEVGDAVRVPTTYKIVESYILKRTLKGIQALKDSLSSQGTEKYKENVNSVQSSIIALKGKTNKLERTAEETKSTITDVEAGLQTQITQNAEGITAEAKRATEKEGELSGRIQVTAGNISAEVTRATNAENSLSGRINVTASDITAEVTRATSAENTLSSRIQITANSISTKVSKGDVVSEINQSADTIELSAGRLIITSGNLTLDSAGNVSMTGNVNATSGEIGPFTITNNGLEWQPNGTKIWANTIRTEFVQPLDSGSRLSIGGDNKPVEISGGSILNCNSGIGLYYNTYIRTMGSNTSILGWSSSNNIHIGDYSRQTLPNALILNSKKVQMVNASGSLVDINSNTSDEREKNILSRIEQEKAVEFIKNLVPITYQYRAEHNPVTHWGFGAQTTLAAMMDSGIGESNLIERNPYIPDAPINPEDDSTFFYSMKPDELAGPFAAAFQYLFKEVEKIKTQTGGKRYGNN